MIREPNCATESQNAFPLIPLRCPPPESCSLTDQDQTAYHKLKDAWVKQGEPCFHEPEERSLELL